MVQLILKLKVTATRAPHVLRALQAVTQDAHWNHGWMEARVCREQGDPETFHYLEEWQTTEDAEREIRSVRFSRLLELMETAAEPPDLQFQFITGVRGLDYVAEVRGDQPSQVS